MTDLATLLEVGGPVAALGGGAAYTRANYPGVYWSTVGLPISTARLLSSYSSVMEACGLTVAPSRLRVLAVKATTRRDVRPVAPRRGIIRPTSTGLRLRLRLAPGQEPADVAASAERLRHAWGVHAVYVTTIKPGVVELRLVGFDVLRKVRMPRRAADGFLKVPVALREDATPFVRDYRTVPHGLTLGATLSGKSMYLRHLVAGLARQSVALVGIDCKRGVELAPFAPRLSALATDPDQAAELLPVLIKEMEDRYDLIKARQGIAPTTPDEEITSDIWGLPEDERPVPVVLFVDEVAELFLVATKKEEERRDEMVTQLIRLAQLGRAAGIYLEVCGQRFGAELGKGATMLRAQLAGRVCHRVNDEASAKMALGDIAPEAVAAACAIAPERPGLAVAGDTSGGWSRLRTPYLSLGDAAGICQESASLTPNLPALKPFRPDAPLQPVDSPAPVVHPRPVTD
ncbi:FtsK/SpoIIIE domain-containing protein [Streptomyces resistomycificus]|uniref:Conjugal transfer protein TraS n=1 Tax=Streptomyces resistomycificus TaxID=67356 RepID=A0A0L8L0E1_9ACTN|nr:FtsK/SpoIIIE domain-containing protein [Streptomyces resistomycificus]KOG31642.1 conjugal transfer protein TraS [Streptomyces resistomycificus]KUN97102.1 conjugal transfer protein TraS [Streptomyces resistomycificus]